MDRLPAVFCVHSCIPKEEENPLWRKLLHDMSNRVWAWRFQIIWIQTSQYPKRRRLVKWSCDGADCTKGRCKVARVFRDQLISVIFGRMNKLGRHPLSLTKAECDVKWSNQTMPPAASASLLAERCFPTCRGGLVEARGHRLPCCLSIVDTTCAQCRDALQQMRAAKPSNTQSHEVGANARALMHEEAISRKVEKSTTKSSTNLLILVSVLFMGCYCWAARICSDGGVCPLLCFA